MDKTLNVEKRRLAKIRLHLLVSTTDIKGVYKHIKNDPNVDLMLFAFEVSQQAHTNEGSKKGITNCVGEEIVKIAMELYPNVKLTDKYVFELAVIKPTDHIAFGFNFNGGEPNEIIVSNITSISEHGILCHFMYGHHSLSEYVKEENVLAIGDNKNGTIEIKGWSGKYKRLKADSKLLDENLK